MLWFTSRRVGRAPTYATCRVTVTWELVLHVKVNSVSPRLHVVWIDEADVLAQRRRKSKRAACRQQHACGNGFCNRLSWRIADVVVVAGRLAEACTDRSLQGVEVDDAVTGAEHRLRAQPGYATPRRG